MTVPSYTIVHAELLVKLQQRQALIGVVGLGYVGLPLCLAFTEKGYRVLGVDIDQSKISAIVAGHSYIHHIESDRIHKAHSLGLLDATTDFARAADADALILCVPTPLNQYREPDLRFIHDTMAALLPYLRPGQVLSLESTTYPGTTEEELRPLVESRGLVIGETFFLVYSPEREDPGNVNFNTATIPKVMGGSTAACREVGMALYEQAITQVVPVSSTKAAEMTKLLENIHRAVNIGLMNELKPLADRMGIDLYEVIRAASTKPFGFVPYYPGPGPAGGSEDPQRLEQVSAAHQRDPSRCDRLASLQARIQCAGALLDRRLFPPDAGANPGFASDCGHCRSQFPGALLAPFRPPRAVAALQRGALGRHLPRPALNPCPSSGSSTTTHRHPQALVERATIPWPGICTAWAGRR